MLSGAVTAEITGQRGGVRRQSLGSQLRSGRNLQPAFIHSG